MPSKKVLQKIVTTFGICLLLSSCTPKVTMGLNLEHYPKPVISGKVTIVETAGLDKNATDYLTTIVPTALLETNILSGQGHDIILQINKIKEEQLSDRESYRGIAQDSVLALQYTFTDKQSGENIITIKSISLGQSSSIVSSRLDSRINAYKHNIEALTKAFEKYTGKENMITSRIMDGDSNIITWITQAPVIAIAEAAHGVGSVAMSAAESLAKNPHVISGISSGLQSSAESYSKIKKLQPDYISYTNSLIKPTHSSKQISAQSQINQTAPPSSSPSQPNSIQKHTTLKANKIESNSFSTNTLKQAGDTTAILDSNQKKQKWVTRYETLPVSGKQTTWYSDINMAEDLAKTSIKNAADKACTDLGGYWFDRWSVEGHLSCDSKEMFGKTNWRCRMERGSVTCRKKIRE